MVVWCMVIFFQCNVQFLTSMVVAAPILQRWRAMDTQLRGAFASEEAVLGDHARRWGLSSWLGVAKSLASVEAR
jgi:hypothetical protein